MPLVIHHWDFRGGLEKIEDIYSRKNIWRQPQLLIILHRLKKIDTDNYVISLALRISN